jgi:hypothetical protein
MVFPNFDSMNWFDGGSWMSKIDNPQKFQNEFESFKKRMGKHSSWFNALDTKKQWDFLFLWKKQKHIAKSTNTQVSLKKFLYTKRKSRQFFVSTQKLRESALNNLFN